MDVTSATGGSADPIPSGLLSAVLVNHEWTRGLIPSWEAARCILVPGDVDLDQLSCDQEDDPLGYVGGPVGNPFQVMGDP